jgi:tricarballylate dehydrogenase
VLWRIKNIGPIFDQAKVRGTPHNQGTACAWHLGTARCPGASGAAATRRRSALTGGNFAPRELTDKSNRLSYPYGVMINRRELRFVDEGEDIHNFTYAKRRVSTSLRPVVMEFSEHSHLR